MLQLALGPKEVQAALSLKTIKRARQLWDEPGFPGFRDPIDGELVDADDLRTWWKRRASAMLAEKGLVNYDQKNACQETAEAERGAPAPERDQEGRQAPGRLDYKEILLRAHDRGSGAKVSRVHHPATSSRPS